MIVSTYTDRPPEGNWGQLPHLTILSGVYTKLEHTQLLHAPPANNSNVKEI